MPRRPITLADAIGADFDRLKVLVTNLLVNNKNFDTGYYQREYPNTMSYVRKVLPDHAQAITERLDALRETVIENLTDEAWTPQRVATLRAEFHEAAFGQYFISQITRTGLGGCCEFMPKADTLDMDAFLARDAAGVYTAEPTLNAAWWAFKAARGVPRDVTDLVPNTEAVA